MFIQLKESAQDLYPVWENIVLIEADTPEQAFEKAQSYGRSEEGDDSGSLTWKKQPATWIFAGVRKLIECESDAERPGDGTELTYIEMQLDSREAVRKLATGKPVHVHRTPA